MLRIHDEDFKMTIYDAVFITNLPAFYKINLYFSKNQLKVSMLEKRKNQFDSDSDYSDNKSLNQGSLEDQAPNNLNANPQRRYLSRAS